MLIASTIIGSPDEDWLFAAVVDAGLFTAEDADAPGGAGLGVVLRLALFLPVRDAFALGSR
jgi:hypothetical protein